VAKQSAGILLFRRTAGGVEVFLVHPGGPFWNGKDAAAWSIPKGEPGEDEALLSAAQREFAEETGLSLPKGEPLALDPVKQPSGKIVHAWALEGDADPSAVTSNSFTLEWPPRSGRREAFPEIDRAQWYSLSEARAKLHKGQVPLLDQLEAMLNVAEPPRA
jgi:predicted NUDIX family NTP pyrophosphohydrolase